MSRVRGKSELPEAPERWYCEECNEVSTEYLTAPNPFDADDIVTGCPICHSVGSLIAACWKCNRPAGMGTPDSKVYRYIQTCFEHRPK